MGRRARALVGSAAIDEHLAWCALRALRPATLRARRSALRRLELIVGPLEAASTESLVAWWATRTTGPENRASELSHASQFYRWLQREERRADDPTARLIRPRLRRRIPKPIPEDDLRLALAATNDRVRRWLLLAAYCGLRAGEIATLHGDDLVENDEGAILVIREGKSARQRIVPVPTAIRDALRPWPSGWVALYADGRPEHISGQLVSQLCNDELHRLGIASTLHRLRHRYGTELYRASLDLRLVQEMLGHASPVTTAGYAAWSPTKARAAVELLPMGV